MQPGEPEHGRDARQLQHEHGHAAGRPRGQSRHVRTITFNPLPTGPYSADIGLIQAINITDQAARTNPTAGLPLDWRNVTDINTGVQGTEAGRMEMMTQGTPGGAPAGWNIDSLPSATPRGGNIGPNYIEHFGNVTQFGWLRSPTDVGPASLFDFPQASFDADFDFETVAKGTDNQTVYGSLFWGFGIRTGAVVGSWRTPSRRRGRRPPSTKRSNGSAATTCTNR